MWTAIWFLVVLKLPVLYLAWVIWWAVKDPPGSDLELGGEGETEGDGGWSPGRRRSRLRPRRGPHGGPVRRPLRARVARVARAKGRL